MSDFLSRCTISLAFLSLVLVLSGPGNVQADLEPLWAIELDAPLGVTGPAATSPSTDYNQDTYPDLKVTNPTGGFTLISGIDGSVLWTFSEGGWAWAGQGNTDLDDGLEIVIAKLGYDTLTGKQFSAIRVLDAATGVTEDERSGAFGTPILVDVDDDGMLEFVVAEGIDTLACYKYAVPTGVLTEPELPRSFELRQNYPNPFNPSTVIEFTLSSRSRVDIDVFNILGQVVWSNSLGPKPAGTHTFKWDGTGHKGQSLASGMYFYRLQADEFVQGKKMLLLR